MGIENVEQSIPAPSTRSNLRGASSEFSFKSKSLRKASWL